MLKPELIEQLRLAPGKRFRLKDHDPGWHKTPTLKKLGKKVVKEQAQAILADDLAHLATAQELLWASDTTAVLIVLQGMDACGKDGTIKHVMSGVNPQGCEVHAFKQPTQEELSHNFLWRYAHCAPGAGGSESSIARITKTCWSCASIPSYSPTADRRRRGRRTHSGGIATRTSTTTNIT